MKKQARITVRLEKEEKASLDNLIEIGKFRNLSSVVRVAIGQFLSPQGQALAEFLKDNGGS